MNPGHIRRYVYLLHDANGDVLYVGMSSNPMGRLRAHMSRPWGGDIDHITIRPFHDEADAVQAEQRAIRELRPPHNEIYNPDAGHRPSGRRKEQVVWAMREVGKPVTQTDVEKWLTDQGIDGVKSFVGTTLIRLERAGVAEVVSYRPAFGGRWPEIKEYALTEVAA